MLSGRSGRKYRLALLRRCVGLFDALFDYLSFVPQCDHRINSRGAAGGDGARDQSDNGQKQPNRGKRNRIGLTDAKELRLKQARECHSERRAHDEPRQCESESLAKNDGRGQVTIRASEEALGFLPLEETSRRLSGEPLPFGLQRLLEQLFKMSREACSTRPQLRLRSLD